MRAGLVFKWGRVLGKMGCLVLTVPFLQSGTGPTNFRSKIRLAVSSTSLPFISREQQGVLVVLLLTTEKLFQFLLIPLMGISQLWLVIGTPEITRWVGRHFWFLSLKSLLRCLLLISSLFCCRPWGKLLMTGKALACLMVFLLTAKGLTDTIILLSLMVLTMKQSQFTPVSYISLLTCSDI